MSKTTLLFFWLLWLLDVLIALLAYREFIGSIFGRYASPLLPQIALWLLLLAGMLAVIGGSLYCKNQQQALAAVLVAALPLILALPYALFLVAVMLGGKNNWQ